jgi:ATPase components of ABC transporters with duplicated ATPase domains
MSRHAAFPGATWLAELARAVVEVESFRLGPVDLELHWGDRLAIVGANGSGKTTLIRALVGDSPLTAGERRTGASVVFGKLTQARDLFHGLLLEDFTALSGCTPTAARTLLAKFALGADDVDRNHLDLDAIEELETALQAYEGCLVVVSHDRRFLERLNVTSTISL